MLANVVFYMTEPPEIKCNKSFTKIKRFQTQVMSKIGQTNRRNYINMPILVEEQYLKEIWIRTFSATVNHIQWNGGTIKVGTYVWTCEESIGNNSCK